MLTFAEFKGINNILPTERIAPDELTSAVNVDIGLSGEVRRRQGFTQVDERCHKNLWQAARFMLATCDGALVAIAPDGARTEIHPALGSARVWYVNLPDGRTAFSNGNIAGITDGLSRTELGVPVPESLGALTPVVGALFPGDYRYQLTYVRESDGLEGGSLGSEPATVTDGGVLLTGLPEREGYAINVYLSSQDDDASYLAGRATGSAFSYLGANDALTQPLRTEFLQPLPAGIAAMFWRGRIVQAVDNLLMASMPSAWELHDARRDFKQFSAPITLIQPTDDGMYVGTETELAFLSGTEFDKLGYVQVLSRRVVLGSGVTVRGDRVKAGQGVGQGTAMLCIADSRIVAGFGGGNMQRLTEARYRTDPREVFATFREVDGIPQYLAVPQ